MAYNLHMQQGYIIPRRAERLLLAALERVPATILIGARQTGKSELARKVAAGRASQIYDLEDAGDLALLSNDAAAELRRQRDKLVVIDEVQRLPDLFAQLRVVIDELRREGRPTGRFLLLGSVTGRLQRQSEGLTGRATEIRLHPLDWLETRSHLARSHAGRGGLPELWNRGGHPRSLLAASDSLSNEERRDYLEKTLYADILSVNTRGQANLVHYQNLLRLLAAKQKDAARQERLASDLGLTQRIVRAMLANLEEMMLVRRLPAYAQEVSRRVAKSPKYYICDSGLFHTVLGRSVHELDSRQRGASWEGFVIENLIAVLPRGWSPYFFRAHGSGHEIDLLLQKPAGELWAIEIKSGNSSAPAGNFLKPLRHLAPERSFVVRYGEHRRRYIGAIEEVCLADMMNELLAQERPPAVAAPASEAIMVPEQGLAAFIAALAEGDGPINLRRTRLVEDLSSRIRATVADDQLAKTENDRLLWVQRRNSLLAWLAAEAAAAPEGRQAKMWIGKFAGLLEGMQNSLPPPWPEHGTSEPGAGANYDFRATFGRLCCHDLFVHAMAILIDNDAGAAAASLMGRKYYVHGHMLASVCLSADNPRGPVAGRQTVADFVTAGAARPTVALIEAEAVLLIHSLLAWEGRSEAAITNPKYLRWPPWLLQAHPSRPDLPFFIKAEDRPGAENLLSCLGDSPDAAAMAAARQEITRHLERGKLDDAAGDIDWEKIERCLNIDRWHSLEQSGMAKKS